MFYGRNDEMKFLEERYKKKEGQLVVLYGRRRIGKTELLRQFCKNKEHVFYVCRETTDREQLNLVSKKLLSDSPLKEYVKEFGAWEDAFRFVKDMPGSGKKLLVLDEFPYMVQNNRSIPSVLQNLWDEVLKNEDVMIILCGSSMSFMEKEILSEKNPLYGRATGIYKVNELDFFTACNFFGDIPNEEKVVRYSILGGVPHYLNQFNHELSTDMNIRSNILSKGCVLYNEVDFLMKQELRETSTYYTIIEAIAMGNTKLNDIYTKTQIEKSKISMYLKNLIDLNIIEREYPITTKTKEKINAHSGIYNLKDNYFKFFFNFIYPNISELEEGDADGVYDYLINPKLNIFASKAFEDICIQYLRKQNKKAALPFRFSKIGRYWYKQNEIDIVAESPEGELIIGECKWKNSVMTAKDLEKLKLKDSIIAQKSPKKYYYLFSKSGFSNDLEQIATVDKSLKLITLDDIFAY